MTRRTASLFDNLPRVDPPNDPTTASHPVALGAAAAGLSVVPPEQAVLSPAAKAFNLQLKRIDKLKSQLQELDALGQAHRKAMLETIAPLEERRNAAMREMALWLDGRLSGPGLSAAQREAAREVLTALARALAENGDAEMAALHDRHSPHSLEQVQRADAAGMREAMEAALGETFDDLPPEADADELMRASMERLRAAQQAEQERRQAAADKRKARKKPSAAQAEAAAQLEDAETWLRKLFRQLASSLHPDRETNPKARLAKTALMSEANAAYGRKDLVALLQIQQRAALAQPEAMADLGDDKLAALTRLLKQQVAELERERAALQAQLGAEFDVPWGRPVDRHGLLVSLAERRMDLEGDIEMMGHDLLLVREDAGFKRWLKQQRKLSQEAQREERWLRDFDPFDASDPF